MDLAILVVAVLIAIILLWVVIKIIRSCLPKTLIGLVVLAILAFVVWYYFIR